MSEPLRDLLDRLAEEQPPVRVAPDTFGRGRRAHRRGVALRVGVAAALVPVGVLVAGPLLEGTGGRPAPAAGDLSPAMPSVLHPVPERLASFQENGPTWHEDLRADGLDIGPTAAVFPVNGGAVMAVSAVDGGYRGLDLPGFDESSYFRFEGVPVALSPDGTRLAWTWNPDVISGSGGAEIESGVRIADLETGEVTDVEIGSPYGVFAHGFGWSPDGRYLAYALQTATSPDGEVRGSRNLRTGLIDTLTGGSTVTPLRGTESGASASDDGAVAVSGGGYNAIWVPGGDPAVRTYRGPFDGTAWSPSGRRTALSSVRGQLAVGDEQGVRRESSMPGADDGRLRVMGWPDDSGFVVLHEGSSTLDLVSADLEDHRILVRADGITDLFQLSVATDLLREPTREMPAPDWPTDWGAVALRVGLGLALLLAGVALVVTLRRRP